MKRTLFAAFAGVVFCLTTLAGCQKKPAQSGSQASAAAELPFDELIVFLPKEAVSIAKDHHGVVLDFSPASVEKVEMILGSLHTEYKKRGTTEGQRGLALAFGVYLGEVIRRRAGEGRWEPDHPQMGVGAMPFYWKSHTSFPVAWCLKRLVNGEEDNVWVKYRLIVEEHLKKD